MKLELLLHEAKRRSNEPWQRQSWERIVGRRRWRLIQQSWKIVLWSERDRLKAYLEGHSGQVIWELGPKSTEADIIKHIRECQPDGAVPSGTAFTSKIAG